jgi:hypothetical protein
MAQPARAFELSSLQDDDPFVSVHESELDVDGSFEHGPWCVDHGDAIVCMSTMQVWMALAAGEIASGTKVWRDGRPCWQAIEHVEELTRDPETAQLADELDAALPEPPSVRVVSRPEPPPTRFPTESSFDAPDVPEQSGVRRIRNRRGPAKRRASIERRLDGVRTRWGRTLAALLAVATLLAVAGALLYPVWLGSPGKLRRVVVDVGERCLVIASQAKQRAREHRP